MSEHGSIRHGVVVLHGFYILWKNSLLGRLHYLHGHLGYILYLINMRSIDNNSWFIAKYREARIITAAECDVLSKKMIFFTKIGSDGQFIFRVEVNNWILSFIHRICCVVINFQSYGAKNYVAGAVLNERPRTTLGANKLPHDSPTIAFGCCVRHFFWSIIDTTIILMRWKDHPVHSPCFCSWQGLDDRIRTGPVGRSIQRRSPCGKEAIFSTAAIIYKNLP